MANSEEVIIVEARNLYKTYRRVTRAPDNVSLNIKRGERVVIVGPNGGGKSTLIKIIMDFTKPDKGYVSILGARVGSRKYDLLRRDMGYMPEKTVIPSHLIVEDRLYIASSLKGCYSYAEEAEMLGLHKFYKRRLSVLSQGYKRRALLVAALVCKPKLLVLDEPYANVDVETRLIVDETLNKLTNDVTMLIASHIKPHFEKFRLALMVSGHVLGEMFYDGDYAELVLSCDSTTHKFSVNPSKENYREILVKINFFITSGCRLQDINIVTFDEILREIFRETLASS